MEVKSLNWIEAECVRALNLHHPSTRETTGVPIRRLNPVGSGPNWTVDIEDVTPPLTSVGAVEALDRLAVLWGTYELDSRAKTSAELVSMIKAEMLNHAVCPPNMQVQIAKVGGSWRAETGPNETHAHTDCTNAVGQISARLRAVYDLKD